MCLERSFSFVGSHQSLQWSSAGSATYYHHAPGGLRFVSRPQLKDQGTGEILLARGQLQTRVYEPLLELEMIMALSTGVTASSVDYRRFGHGALLVSFAYCSGDGVAAWYLEGIVGLDSWRCLGVGVRGLKVGIDGSC